MALTPVETQILGRTFKFNCPEEDAEALLKAAQDLNDRLQTLKAKTTITSLDQLLITAALNISYELEQTKMKDRAGELENRAEALCRQLDEVLSHQN